MKSSVDVERIETSKYAKLESSRLTKKEQEAKSSSAVKQSVKILSERANFMEYET